MANKLTEAMRKALTNAVNDPSGELHRNRIPAATFKALREGGYIIHGEGVTSSLTTISEKGIDALGLNSDEVYINQAKRRLDIMRQSFERVTSKLGHGFGEHDLKEAQERVASAERDLARVMGASDNV